MNGEMTIRQSPVVLMWKFAVIEAAAVFLYCGLVLLGNTKYELYTQLSFSGFLSYQTAKILLLSGAQFALTIYAFLSWYYEQYTVQANEVTHTRGVLRRKSQSFPAHRGISFG